MLHHRGLFFHARLPKGHVLLKKNLITLEISLRDYLLIKYGMTQTQLVKLQPVLQKMMQLLRKAFSKNRNLQ